MSPYSERPVKRVLHRRAQQTSLVFNFKARTLVAQLGGFATRGRLPENLQFLGQTDAPILRVRVARTHPIVTQRVQVRVELACIVRRSISARAMFNLRAAAARSGLVRSASAIASASVTSREFVVAGATSAPRMGKGCVSKTAATMIASLGNIASG